MSDSRIGPYILERELGRGAFGVVYAGRHEDRTDTLVAVKTVPVSGDDDRAMLEPALLARLKHPNIVGLDDYFVADGRLVLALEFVPGEDLKGPIDRGETFTVELVREFLLQLASALATAHAVAVVHRDIKPSNILVDTSTGRTRFVLTDFGVGREASGVQAEKHVGGTYLYMAPEQLRGRPAAQSDLWALGVVAYQMLTGSLPFPGPTLNELAKQIQYGDPVPPSEKAGTPVPAALEAVVLGLLNKSLSERTASADDLLKALGGRADTRKPTETRTDVRKSATRTAEPLSKKLDRGQRNSQALMILFMILLLLPNGMVSSTLSACGYYQFARGQKLGARRRTGAALLLIACGQAFQAVLPEYNLGLATWVIGWLAGQIQSANPVMNLGLAQGIVGWIIIFWTVGLTMLICSQYANYRRLTRERTLLGAAMGGAAGSAEFLGVVREMVNSRFADVGLHLRYAEALYAKADHRGAAVEALLIRDQDPYHFNANLLLANCYYALGLYDDCLDVCEDYLDVTGYCFEFAELKAQCDARIAA